MARSNRVQAAQGDRFAVVEARHRAISDFPLAPPFKPWLIGVRNLPIPYISS